MQKQKDATQEPTNGQRGKHPGPQELPSQNTCAGGSLEAPFSLSLIQSLHSGYESMQSVTCRLITCICGCEGLQPLPSRPQRIEHLRLHFLCRGIALEALINFGQDAIYFGQVFPPCLSCCIPEDRLQQRLWLSNKDPVVASCQFISGLERRQNLKHLNKSQRFQGSELAINVMSTGRQAPTGLSADLGAQLTFHSPEAGSARSSG